MKRMTTLLSFLLCWGGWLKADGATFMQKAQQVPIDLSNGWIEVSVRDQNLRLWKQGELLASYPISTAKRGVGQIEGTNKTPLGLHQIHRKVGDKAPLYTIFKMLKNTGTCWDPSQADPGEDLILTRVLTLKGLEPSFNKGKDSKNRSVDSLNRRIYLHGTAQESLIGQCNSHGCVRLRNADILILFEKVEAGMAVWIHNDEPMREETMRAFFPNNPN